jgi:hypothetical protein
MPLVSSFLQPYVFDRGSKGASKKVPAKMNRPTLEASSCKDAAGRPHYVCRSLATTIQFDEHRDQEYQLAVASPAAQVMSTSVQPSKLTTLHHQDP